MGGTEGVFPAGWLSDNIAHGQPSNVRILPVELLVPVRALTETKFCVVDPFRSKLLNSCGMTEVDECRQTTISDATLSKKSTGPNIESQSGSPPHIVSWVDIARTLGRMCSRTRRVVGRA